MNDIYKKLASFVTTFFIQIGTINNKQKDVYLYGFEILISTVSYFIIFISTAILTNTLTYSLVFWIGFFMVRTICGGYHAKTYFACHLLFFINHMLFILFIKGCPQSLNGVATFIFLFISGVIILLFAPVDHPNKSFIKNEYKRFKRISRIYSILIILISCIILLVHNYLFIVYLLCFAIGTFSSSISLLSAKFLYRKEEPQNEKNQKNCN